MFQRSCLYHKTEGMRVIEADQEDVYKRLRDSGEWFDSPVKAKEFNIAKEKEHEGQIRRVTRKRRSDAEPETKAL